jgi:arginine exporter protein ArgO
VLVLGVFLGSAAWWLLLVGLVGLLRDKFTRQGLVWVNRISGLIILGFGIVSLAGSLSWPG